MTLNNQSLNDLIGRASNDAAFGLLICDRQGAIIWANRRTLDWFGYDLDELTDRPVEVLVPEGGREAHRSLRARYNARPMSRAMGENALLLAKRSDDSLFSVDISLQPIHYADQQYVLATIINRKDRRQIESERQIELSQMQQRVVSAERVAAVGQMVKGLAHETHNSLQRAISSLDLLDLDLEPGSDEKKVSGRIRSALSDLHQVWREVEQYASPLHLARKPTDLKQICLESLEALADQCDDHDLEIEGNAEGVDVDPSQFRVLFGNLIDNAISAAAGRAKIRISFEQFDNILRISIQDASGGVARENIGRITDPFFTTKQKGAGLGLALCKRIAEAHGGTLTVKNHHQGLAVTVTIPSSRV